MQQSQNTSGLSKIIIRLFWAAFFGVLAFLTIFYLSTPFFSFKNPQPFSGAYMHSPYPAVFPQRTVSLSFDLNALHLADLLINGKLKTNFKFYDTLTNTTDKIDISNFQFMHRFIDTNNDKLLIYRHGYGLTNDQQLCFGAKKVVWTDYPFFQDLRHKQDIIWKLNQTSDLVALTDPGRSYTSDELRFLSGYQLIELTNTDTAALKVWDIALSHGHRVNLLLSNLSRSQSLNLEEQKIHTIQFLINELNIKQLLDCLENGNYYCLSRPESVVNTPAPQLQQLVIQNDTFNLGINIPASEIRLIGQDGRLLSRLADTNQLNFLLRSTDTYLRAEMQFADGSQLFINPVFRHENIEFQRQSPASFDSDKTALMRGIYTVLFVLFFMIIFRIFLKRVRN